MNYCKKLEFMQNINIILLEALYNTVVFNP